VKQQKRDSSGNPVGVSNANPLLDTREYEVEFPDGAIDVLTANTIAESLYSQVDQEGNSYSVKQYICREILVKQFRRIMFVSFWHQSLMLNCLSCVFFAVKDV
jgi:hypothetical protein